jgi:hypothetical protein
VPENLLFRSAPEFSFPPVSQIRDEAGNEGRNSISPPQDPQHRANRNSALSQFAVPRPVRPTAAQRVLDTNSPAPPSQITDRSEAGKLATASKKSLATDNAKGKQDNGKELQCDNCEHPGRDDHDVWCEVAHNKTLS